MKKTLLFMFLFNCTTQDSKAPQEIIPQDPAPTPIEAGTLKESEIILSIQDEYPQYAGTFNGLLREALGDETAVNGDHKLAAEFYGEALKESSRAFSIGILPKLAGSLLRADPAAFTTPDSLSLAVGDLAAAANAGQSISEFETSRRQAFSKFIAQEFAWAFVKPAAAAESPHADSLPATIKWPLPKDDPVFNDRFTLYCRNREALKNEAPAWAAALTTQESSYWQSLVTGCSDKAGGMAALRSFLADTGGTPALSALRLNAGRKIVEFYRAEGNRSDLPDLYLLVTGLWTEYQGDAGGLGLKPLAFELARINDLLWAARYRSLVGDYAVAKEMANQALKEISNAYSKVTIRTAKEHQELAVLRAEAYHALAFRIALEERQIESAIAQTQLALTTPYLTAEWQQTLNRNLGTYYFLANDFPRSIEALKKASGGKPPSEWEDRELFWAAYAHLQMQQLQQATDLLTLLAERHPLSFYNLVATESLERDVVKVTRPYFESRGTLIRKFSEFSNLGIGELRSHPQVGAYLAKTELLLNFGLIERAQTAFGDLEKAMQQSFGITERPHAYIYLTRIAHAAGLYQRSIDYNDRLSKTLKRFWQQWPEQIMLSFPKPFADIMVRRAVETGVDQEVLLAVTRQESLFNPVAASPAGAYGLMQIIPETARRFASQAGFPHLDAPAKKLAEPDFNLQIGALYLQHLTRHYESFYPAVFAAYNAGEAAVDAWLKRRFHPDPLIWVELIPYGETRNYVKKVWRNDILYRRLASSRQAISKNPSRQPSLALQAVDEAPTRF